MVCRVFYWHIMAPLVPTDYCLQHFCIHHSQPEVSFVDHVYSFVTVFPVQKLRLFQVVFVKCDYQFTVLTVTRTQSSKAQDSHHGWWHLCSRLSPYNVNMAHSSQRNVSSSLLTLCSEEIDCSEGKRRSNPAWARWTLLSFTGLQLWFLKLKLVKNSTIKTDIV